MTSPHADREVDRDDDDDDDKDEDEEIDDTSLFAALVANTCPPPHDGLRLGWCDGTITGGRGLYLTRDDDSSSRSASRLFLAVPVEAMLTVERGDVDDPQALPWDVRLAVMLLRAVSASGDDADTNDATATASEEVPRLHLHRRRRRVFDWGEYRRRLLPTAAELTHIGSFDRREATMLEDTRLEREWERLARVWKEAFARLRHRQQMFHKNLPQHKSWSLPAGVTEGDFRWAMAIVSTRAFNLSPPPGGRKGGDGEGDGDGDGGSIAALVPLIDLANHASDGSASIRWGVPSRLGHLSAVSAGAGNSTAVLELVMRDDGVRADDTSSEDSPQPATPAAAAAAAVASDDELRPPQRQREVCLSYLPLARATNRELFLKFGFSERGNPHDDLPWWAMEPLVALVFGDEGDGEIAAPATTTTAPLSRSRLLRAAGLTECSSSSSGGGGGSGGGDGSDGSSSPAACLRFVDVDVADEMGDEQAERVVTAARGLLKLTARREAGAGAGAGVRAGAGVPRGTDHDVNSNQPEPSPATVAAAASPAASAFVSCLELALAERAPVAEDIARLFEEEGEEEAEDGAWADVGAGRGGGDRLTPRERASLEFRCEAKLVVHAAVEILRRYEEHVDDNDNHHLHGGS